MKRVFTFLLSLSIVSMTLWAQEVDRSFVFVDENGTEIENGATVVRDQVVYGEENVVIYSGISVMNAAGSNDYIKMHYTIERIDNGIYQLCFPTTCNMEDEVGTFETGQGQLMSNVQDIMSEWFPAADGECIVKLTIELLSREGFFPPTYVHKAYGPSVTVQFVKSSSASDDSFPYVKLADGVYLDGTTLYICNGVTSLGGLQINPSEIYCYAAIPPSCLANTFTGYDATLHVPAASMVSYFTALYWYNFNNILSDAIEPLSVTMNSTEAEVGIGQQLSLSATVTPVDATPKTVYWSSTDPSVATVSSGGTVTAVAAGECDIFARCIDKVAVCHVTVVPQRVTITLDKHEARLLPNHTITLTAICSPADVDLAVSTSNPGVAIPRLVNGTIMVVGVAEGTAVITVNAADGCGNPDSCAVTVYTEHGDVNCDGYISISDVTKLINFLLSDSSEGISANNADTNMDGKVSISDVTALISYLLSGIWSWERPITYTVNGVSFKMVPVEGGAFIMGASDDDADANDNEKPTHQVTLSSYSIGETEVTQALWQAVMGSNPSEFTGDLNRPVEKVSWFDCQAFITKLNQLTGKIFRLPTEAEWEFAARGGNKSNGYTYAGSSIIDDVAWYYYVNAPRITQTVATKAPNELGLYDMSGNVLEWCQDWYGPYSNEAQTNPVGSSTGSDRVCRGGSWAHTAVGCRVSERRGYTNPAYSYRSLGLRLVLGPDISPTPDTHEYVDLGLPSGTLWATMNIGACLPEEYGDYFAWGETEPKNLYDDSTYKWCSESDNKLTKYCTNIVFGTVDSKSFLDPQDDAAFVNWGPSWRIPSREQQDELVEQCTWTWTTRNGVNGQLVTGPNGNSIFLPAAGFRSPSSPVNAGMDGCYWSRSVHFTFPTNAYGMDFGSEGMNCHESGRSVGQTVRAVRGPKTDFYVEQQSLDFGLVSVGLTCTIMLTIVNNTVEDLTLTATSDEPFSFKQGEDVTSSMTIEVPSQSSNLLMVMFSATTPGQFNGNVTIQKSTLDGDHIVVPIHALAYAYPSAQQEDVDLGLPSGTLWATCNVGANSPEEYGDYFAWGETTHKLYYSWENYKWCNGSLNRLTKYCTHAQYGNGGMRDNKTELELNDDAAYVKMGSSWSIPTTDQLSELRAKCSWLWTMINGTNGYLVIGPNGSTIFLPATGYRSSYSLNVEGSYGYYWARKLVYLTPCYAYSLKFNSNDIYSSSETYRNMGLAVRAVRR